MITYRHVSMDEALGSLGRNVYSSLRTFEPRVIVAFEEGRPIGHILWEGDLITDLLVDEDVRGKGVGKELVRRAEKEMLREGWSASIVPATESPDYYTNLGYDSPGMRGPRTCTFKTL